MNAAAPVGCSCVVYLRHTASSLTLTYVASPEMQVDVGTIASHFSLQPNSLLFNGHFISRDAHFISGLSWGQLLSFFRGRGLSCGSQALNPVEVQGRPVVQLPNQDSLSSDCEHLCHNEYQSAKRSAFQSSFVSPSKRIKRNIDSGAQTSSLIPSKLKRHACTDESLFHIRDKRARPDKNYAGWEIAGESHLENEANCGSKRQIPLVEVGTERSLWKRLKEVEV